MDYCAGHRGGDGDFDYSLRFVCGAVFVPIFDRAGSVYQFGDEYYFPRDFAHHESDRGDFATGTFDGLFDYALKSLPAREAGN